jgi:predicted CoA-binding protein
MRGLVSAFLECSRFAVVGASASREKFGNKVFRCYLMQGLDCVPVNPREPEIEGIKCIKGLDDLVDPKGTALSFVTPPAVTLGMVEKAASLGCEHFWLQPGAEDAAVLAKCKELKLSVIHSGPCVLVQFGCDEHAM